MYWYLAFCLYCNLSMVENRMKVLKIIGISLAVVAVITAGLFASGYGQSLMFKAFVAYNKPAGSFKEGDAVTAPDYANREFWAALPDMQDPADLVPAGINAIVQGEGKVDTFFIHPTGYLNSASWMSPMDKDTGTEENTQWMMANQASAYNGCCNVYAPRYREATIFSYFESPEQRDALLGFAYRDVKRAFEYYLENYNEGRPFIIASHSQGTHHAKRLLKEVIDTSDLHERMVASYMIGAVQIPISPTWFNSMQHITACESANALHCVVHWDTMAEGSAGVERPQEGLCTNPLTWRVNEDMADAALNEGAVVPGGKYILEFGKTEDLATGQKFTHLGAPRPGQTAAQCRDGTLFVTSQSGNDFDSTDGMGDGSYHGLDYALFYMNIHSNAKLKVETYLMNSR
ncbi:MAG: hypothetical protein ACJA2O_001193 [Candidatus Azotimanducaceae bacterium]|jgi:hypothetical protein